MKRLLPLPLLLVLGFAIAADAPYPLDAPAPDGRRPGGTLTEEFMPPPLRDEENKDLRRERNYPEQPPTIPHAVRNYQIDINGNRCLACHSREASARTQAPMISITHFNDRDGQTLGTVSPRRYFCMQCHVPQHDVEPLVGNDFKDIDTLLYHESTSEEDE